jgi:SAM-dependent methyltransferase
LSEAARHDAWQAGASYDAYMGRWSRLVAPRFLDWLDATPGLAWLDVGCGTGALSAAIIAGCAPQSLVSIDASEGFVATARRNVPDVRATFRVGDAQSLGEDSASRDVVASGLVLNFIPDRPRALAEMRRVARPGGAIGFYVWDYAGGGVEFMRAFWDAAAALDPAARELGEDRRFSFCTADGLTELAVAAGLSDVECIAIEIATPFRDFDDFWQPFTLGAGPAPGYCMSLAAEARQRLQERLRADLPRGEEDTIPLKARAWAIKARAR